METLSLQVSSTFDEEIGFVADADTRVMVTAESHTLRRFIADQIHRRSRRAGGPLVVATSADLPEQRRLLQRAASGTLFIDIERITTAEQQALLDFIGAVASDDVRVITGAPPDLVRAVETNQFDRGLFYRLNLLHVVFPTH